MIRINLAPDAVKIATRFADELDQIDRRTREAVLNILWFDYIGRHFNWQRSRLWRDGDQPPRLKDMRSLRVR